MKFVSKQHWTELTGKNKVQAWFMAAHSKILVEKFCGLCQWTYEAWRTHRGLFDDNHNSAKLKTSKAANALDRISVITHEHFLLQIVKLHDPATQQGQINLGLDYMIRFGGWDESIKSKLEDLKKQLDEFVSGIKPAGNIKSARNKILSHNDLETILNESVLGAFGEDVDKEYFKTLEEFVSLICQNTIGESWHYFTDVEPETQILVSELVR